MRRANERRDIEVGVVAMKDEGKIEQIQSKVVTEMVVIPTRIITCRPQENCKERESDSDNDDEEKGTSMILLSGWLFLALDDVCESVSRSEESEN